MSPLRPAPCRDFLGHQHPALCRRGARHLPSAPPPPPEVGRGQRRGPGRARGRAAPAHITSVCRILRASDCGALVHLPAPARHAALMQPHGRVLLAGERVLRQVPGSCTPVDAQGSEGRLGLREHLAGME